MLGANRVHRILTEAAYNGMYLFNQLNVRPVAVKPREEWIPMPEPAIVPPEVFEAVASLRRERSPDVTPPRVVTSPTLLTGLLRCANCGLSVNSATHQDSRSGFDSVGHRGLPGRAADYFRSS